MGFYDLQKKQLLDEGLDAVKTAPKKVVHNSGEFLRNTIADTITKSKNEKVVKQEPIQEIIFP